MSRPRQTWEYARIYHWDVGSDPFATLTYYQTTGPKTSVIKNKAFSKDGRSSKELDTWIIQLGQEGYEMVNYTSVNKADTYWFKRPK